MTAQQLKNSILQMAVQGKLVPQDPNDEPASVLIERICAEKEKLIKEKKIKKEKNPSVIFRGADNIPYEKIGDEVVPLDVPFDIPDSWEWARLGDIFWHNTGKALNASNRSGTLLSYITTSNLYWNRFEMGSLREMYFTDEEVEKCTVTKGDLLVCEGGDIGRAAIWPFDYNVRIQNHIHRLRAYIPVCTEYYYFLLYLYKHVGWIGGKGIGIQGLSSNALHAILLPVPPVKEQYRIVSKIQEIEPYTDKYTQADNELEKLNTCFPEKLKKSILQMAVQGKLVPQDENDEPAEVLLERIRAEKEALIKAGKIKRDKHESVIFRRDNSHYEKLDGIESCIDDEIPFKIPESWSWSRLGFLLEIARGGSPRPIQDFLTTDANGVNWIKIGDTDKGGKYIYETHEKIKPEGIKKSRFVKAGDFLLTNSMSFGRPYILKTDGCIHDGWLVLADNFNCFIVDYLYYLLSSPYAYYQFCGTVSGAVVKNLNSDKVANSLFPIPPLAEQQRIVNRIEELIPTIKAL